MAQGLKVGDKVKTSDGAVGEVVAVRTPADYFDVKVPGVYGPSSVTPGAGTYHKDRLEKLDPEPKFKVGDRVLDHKYSKRVVTVVATDAHPSWPIRARYADGSLGLWKESELAKVESVPFKLERGDRVVNIKTGREGEVIHDLVFDTKPPFGAPVPVKAIEEYEEHHPGTYDLIKARAPW